MSADRNIDHGDSSRSPVDFKDLASAGAAGLVSEADGADGTAADGAGTCIAGAACAATVAGCYSAGGCCAAGAAFGCCADDGDTSSSIASADITP